MRSTFSGHDITNRIAILLKAKGFTRDDLANYIGKNKQVFTDWKNRNIILKSDDLYNISKFLGVPMEYILTGEESIPDDVAVGASLLQSIEPEKRPAVIAMIRSQVEFQKGK